MGTAQTIIKSQTAVGNFTSDLYKTERKDSWSLDVLMNTSADVDFKISMETSSDGINWNDSILKNETVDKNNGRSFVYDILPFDNIRFVIISDATVGDYDILFTER